MDSEALVGLLLFLRGLSQSCDPGETPPQRPTGTPGEEGAASSHLLRLREGMRGTGSSCLVTHWAEPG